MSDVTPARYHRGRLVRRDEKLRPLADSADDIRAMLLAAEIAEPAEPPERDACE